MQEHRDHAEHTHVHGPTCGHPSETHEDHVDYLHDGHRHRAHEQHWDECEIRQTPAGERIAPESDMTRPEELRTSTGPD